MQPYDIWRYADILFLNILLVATERWLLDVCFDVGIDAIDREGRYCKLTYCCITMAVRFGIGYYDQNMFY